jgi:hypothetical protein
MAAPYPCRRIAGRGAPLLDLFKRTGYVHQSLSIEAGRLMNASARMMDTFQSGLLAIAKVRNGGQQTTPRFQTCYGRRLYLWPRQ